MENAPLSQLDRVPDFGSGGHLYKFTFPWSLDRYVMLIGMRTASPFKNTVEVIGQIGLFDRASSLWFRDIQF